MSTLGERLVELRKEKGVTQREAAKAMGFSPAALNFYEHDTRMPKKAAAIKLCEYYRCDMNFLYGTAKDKISPKTPGVAVSIFQLEQLVGGVINAKDSVSSFSLPATILDSESYYFAIEVPDDSMLGASIKQGDYAVFRLSETLRAKETMLVVLDGKVMIRTCIAEGNKVVKLIPANENLKPVTPDASSILVLLGSLAAVVSIR